jgi:hypothetical protein
MSREAPFGRLWHNRDFSPVIYIGVLGHDDLFKLGHTRSDSLGRRQSQLRRELGEPGLKLHPLLPFSLDTPISEVVRREKSFIADLRSRGLQFIRHRNTEVVVFPTTRDMQFWRISAGMKRLPQSLERERNRRWSVFRDALLNRRELKRRRRASRSRSETIQEYKRRMPNVVTSRLEQHASEESKLNYLGSLRRKREEQQLAALGPLGERPMKKQQLELGLATRADPLRSGQGRRVRPC